MLLLNKIDAGAVYKWIFTTDLVRDNFIVRRLETGEFEVVNDTRAFFNREKGSKGVFNCITQPDKWIKLT